MTKNVTVLCWSQARELILKINPTLTLLIDKINPDKRFTFYKINYAFGDEIIKQGSLRVPDDEGLLLNLADYPYAHRLIRDLNYNFGANPVGIVLNHSTELFLELEDRIVPFASIPSGDFFGLWQLLDSSASHCPFTCFWGMTAGARSLFMLAKISNAISHNRMKKEFRLQADAPKNLQSHWHVFKEIANNSDIHSQWSTELLFFSQEWFEHLEDPLWKDFHCYLLERAWRNSGFWRNQFTWQLIFSIIQNKQKAKLSAYIADLAQHMLMVSTGALPGFAPALDDKAGPIQAIQQVYQDSYNLKSYAPIIMQPQLLSDSGFTKPIYLSLQHPTAIQLTPRFSKRTNALADLLVIQKNISEYSHTLLDKQFNINATPLSEIPHDVEFDYFHSNPNNHLSILKSSQIPLEDDNFSLSYFGEERLFPADSSFFKGCIRIKSRA